MAGEHKCVVSYCCCGCELKSGSLAIGIVVLILSLVSCIYNIYEGIKYGIVDRWISFVVDIVVIIVTCLLIQGIRTDRRNFIMSWVWTMVVMIIVNIILSLIAIITVPSYGLFYGLVTLVVMGTFIYLVVVVRSYGLTLSGSSGMA